MEKISKLQLLSSHFQYSYKNTKSRSSYLWNIYNKENCVPGSIQFTGLEVRVPFLIHCDRFDIITMFLLFKRAFCDGDHPWIGNIPWRRKWKPTPVFLPGKSHGQRSLQFMGLQRVTHDLATKQHQHTIQRKIHPILPGN